MLHLQNASLARVRQDAVSFIEAGLTFRRLLRDSLVVLAARLVANPHLVDPGGRRAHVPLAREPALRLRRIPPAAASGPASWRLTSSS